MGTENIRIIIAMPKINMIIIIKIIILRAGLGIIKVINMILEEKNNIIIKKCIITKIIIMEMVVEEEDTI